MTVEDFQIIYGVSEEEFEFAENNDARINESGCKKLIFFDDEGDGIEIIVNGDEVTHIYAR
jgi:hypothetical protein